MVVNHESWPSDGRLGLCTKGEYKGFYALVTAEIEDRWIIYVSSMPDVSGAVAKGTDFTTVDEVFDRVVADMGIEWVASDIESDLEVTVFGLREYWRSLREKADRRRRHALIIRDVIRKLNWK